MKQAEKQQPGENLKEPKRAEDEELFTVQTLNQNLQRNGQKSKVIMHPKVKKRQQYINVETRKVQYACRRASSQRKMDESIRLGGSRSPSQNHWPETRSAQ